MPPAAPSIENSRRACSTAERGTKYQRAAAGAMALSQLLTPYTVGNLENSFKLKGQGSCSHDHSKNNSA
jgi:hypothetical protein